MHKINPPGIIVHKVHSRGSRLYINEGMCRKLGAGSGQPLTIDLHTRGTSIYVRPSVSPEYGRRFKHSGWGVVLVIYARIPPGFYTVRTVDDAGFHVLEIEHEQE